MTTTLACDHASVGSEIRDRVVLAIDGGRIVAVEPNSDRFDDAGTHLPGLTLPGLVNAHSHAFHRVLRGRTHAPVGTFWTWRERMYTVASALDPDSYRALAAAVFAEMLEAGITCVGEFHYLHHDRGGRRYAESNAMGHALLQGAADAGIRITVLDALYLTAGVRDTLAAPGLSPVQRRFSDGDTAAWSTRLEDLRSAAGDTARIGAAVHSLRAVPPPELAAVAAATASWSMPVHAHVAEQPAEVEECLAVHGASPVQLLSRGGIVGPTATAVHGIWLDGDDVALLGDAHACVCACPTTERDLADGVVPARSLRDAGATLALGSDQHAVIDLLEEARALELDLRLVSQQRGSLQPAELLAAATAGGARSLGWDDMCGTIRPGAAADLCTVGLSSCRLAGLPRSHLLPGVLYAATAEDVTHTMVAGRMVVADGRHTRMDVPQALRAAIATVDARAEDAGG